MRNIVHIVSQPPGAMRGNSVAHRVIALAAAQKKAGLQVSVWYIGRRLTAERHAVEIQRFPLHKNHFAIDRSLGHALDSLPQGSVVHLHGAFVPEYVTIAFRTKRSAKKPALIVSPHGAYNEFTIRRLPLLKKVYYYLFERFVIRRASLIHLVGPSEINGYNRFSGGITPFICIPDGPVIDTTDLAAMVKHDGTKDPFVVTYCGRIDLFRKGLDILLEAFAVFTGEVYTPVELWILGNGKDLKKIRQIAASLGVSDKVKFLQPAGEVEQDRLLQQSHVVVQPSRNDGIPSAVLQAASHGVPAIVSEETNLGAYVRQYHAGWSLAENRADDLLKTLHEAYVIYKTDDESYTRLNRNSCRMIREELNWNTLARRWDEVYGGL